MNAEQLASDLRIPDNVEPICMYLRGLKKVKERVSRACIQAVINACIFFMALLAPCAVHAFTQL
jgi:hypothetical protein